MRMAAAPCIYAAIIMLFATGAVQAAEGDHVAGEDKAVLCQRCHGKEGMSIAPDCPNLAGQYSEYIIKQLRDILARKRNDPAMSPMAATIASEQDMFDIAAYFASRTKMQGTPAKSENVRGKELYLQGDSAKEISPCLSCHGDDGKGIDNAPSFFPVIGGQKKRYLIKQLKDMRDGKRVNDLAGIMRNVAKNMTDADIEAVAEYLSKL